MNLDDTAVIELVLGLNESVNELRKRIKEAGEVEDARIRVSERMKASLSGQNFFHRPHYLKKTGGIGKRDYQMEMGSPAQKWWTSLPTSNRFGVADNRQ